MNYYTYAPHPDLASFVKCYWTLEVPADRKAEPQRIIPDGCLEMIFILGDDIKRYTADGNFILQPRAMLLGQTTDPFFVEPTGYVYSFAVRFYPHGFANFISVPVKQLANTETPLTELFEEATVLQLEQAIIHAKDTAGRIAATEDFLFKALAHKTVIDRIVSTTVDALLAANGSIAISAIVSDDLSKRRQLERKFFKQVGMSPKQLGKVIRLQAALKMVLNNQTDSLTGIAYENEYYDQAHFIRDFKEFTGTRPKDFLNDGRMALSTLFYKEG